MLPSDPRLLSAGHRIPSLLYCDQVYVVPTNDGAWLAVMTTGPGKEGGRGQHIVAWRSTDHGGSWSDAVAIEPPEGPEASYAVLLKTPGGRVYAFYNYNADDIREVPMEDGHTARRVDSLGRYVFRFSNDHGRTWSGRRYEVPVRAFACDLANFSGGKTRLFWNVGRPFIGAGGKVYLPHSKVGALGSGFYAQSEGCLLCSDNILTETDPEKIRFQTLPEGDTGLRTPAGGGRVSEEQSLVQLSDGSLFCIYRSIDGHPVSAYSRDEGRTWEPPQYAAYEPGGRRIKHPRAANFVWKCSNGRYLYWFHNHGGGPAARGDWDPYMDRNPAWLAAGHEVDSPGGKRIAWSQPEILLYDDDPFIRVSYPDLIEDDGRFFVTETQKSVARLHEIEPALIAGLFAQKDARVVAPGETDKLPAFYVRDTSREDMAGTHTRAGFSLEIAFTVETWTPGRELFSNGRVRLAMAGEGRVEISLADGRTKSCWSSDPGTCGPGRQHIVVTVDSGPKIITFVVNGVLCDGGADRQFGWGRFSPLLTNLNGTRPVVDASVSLLRIYERALRTSEAVGNFRAQALAHPASLAAQPGGEKADDHV